MVLMKEVVQGPQEIDDRCVEVVVWHSSFSNEMLIMG